MTSPSLSKEIFYLIVQHLEELSLGDVARKLEELSAGYFNPNHFEDQVCKGNWDTAKQSLCGNLEANHHSAKLFFEAQRYKCLKAVKENHLDEAHQITVKDLSLFSNMNEELCEDCAKLFTLHSGMLTERSSIKCFKFSQFGARFMSLQGAAGKGKDPWTSTRRTIWSIDDCLFGVAYSPDHVHIYSYHGGSGIRRPLENWKRSSVQQTCEAEAVEAFQYFKMAAGTHWKSCQSMLVRSLATRRRPMLSMSKPEEVISYPTLSAVVVKSLMQNLDQQIVEVKGARKLEFFNIVRNQKNRKGRMVSTSLPEHVIIYEILPRLPVKSLMRFRSVCKSWQAIISGNGVNLIALQLQQSRQKIRVLVTPADQHGSGIVSCHFVQERSSNICQSELIVDMPELEYVASTCMPSHCDGLLLFSSANELYVCNPATRELAILPRSAHINSPSRTQALLTPYNGAAICHDPRTNKYKVVRFFYRWSDLRARACSLGLEILTLGSETLCWIASQQDPPYPIWPVEYASSSDGVIYWIIDNTLHSSSPQAIMSFNIIEGKFGVLPPPPIWEKNLDSFPKEALICELDGYLCCSLGSDPLRRIYMLKKWKYKNGLRGRHHL